MLRLPHRAHPHPLLLIVFIIAGCASTPDEPSPPANQSVLTGTVTYRERIALPPQAVLYVQLVDVTQDLPPVIIAEQRIDDPGQPPMAFELPYDPARIEPTHAYEVMARIEVEDEIIFLAPGSDAVLTRGGGDTVAITAQMIRRGLN
jgi:putative lipoprotein